MPVTPAESKEKPMECGALQVLDEDYEFVLEEVHLREDNNEYDVAVANYALHLEREEQQWISIDGE